MYAWSQPHPYTNVWTEGDVVVLHVNQCLQTGCVHCITISLLGLMGRIVKGCVREVSLAQVSCTSKLKIQKREYRDGIKSRETRPGWGEAHNVYKACVGTTEGF